jgi:two-component system phosphate regulon sensor histidine kinase PhoR
MKAPTPWQSAVKRWSLSILATIAVDALLGTTPWGLLILLIGYSTWNWAQLYRFKRWLTCNEQQEPPLCQGLWGAIFDEVYQIQKRQKISQRKLKNVLKRIQESTAALKEGVLMVDSDGTLEWWNASATELLGLRSPDDVGQPITNLLRAPAFKRYFEATEYDDPLEISSPINPQFTLEFQLTLFGKLDRLILVRNVTQIKQLEAMRQDFVANVSHELRTPLTVITGYLETFLDQASLIPPRWLRALEQMSTQGRRMQNLVTDLLLLSRLETTLSKEPTIVRMRPLLEAIQQDALDLSGEKNHEITLEIDDFDLLGLESELRSAFSNLVFNAVKYTPAEGKIEIRWKTDHQGGSLSVKDNGIGVDPVHLPRLTERFYRVDASRNLDTGGTGLGLAIVKHVLIRHQGHLRIHSHLEQGSEFVCHFPGTRLIRHIPANEAS